MTWSSEMACLRTTRFLAGVIINQSPVHVCILLGSVVVLYGLCVLVENFFISFSSDFDNVRAPQCKREEL